MTIIKDALDAYAKTQREKEKFSHDRTKTVGASEIGLCARRVYWAKNGQPADAEYDDTYGAALRGNLIEEHFWVPAMIKKFRRKLLFAGKKQKTIEDGYLSATPDGIIVDIPRNALAYLGVPDTKADCLVVECKSIDPRVDLSKEKEEHTFQVQAQLGLIRKCTPYKPEYAVISYTDASFLHEIDEYAVKFDEDVFAQAESRAAHILTATHPEELPPEGWIGGGKECDYCPFAVTCGFMRTNVPGKEYGNDDPQFVAELTDACLRVVKARAEAGKVDQRYREAQEEVKELLRKKGVRKVPHVVTWSPQKGRKSYDMPKLREAAEAKGVNVEAFCTVGQPSDRLQITLSIGETP